MSCMHVVFTQCFPRTSWLSGITAVKSFGMVSATDTRDQRQATDCADGVLGEKAAGFNCDSWRQARDLLFWRI